MDDDNVDQGLDADMGSYVEDARGYDPEESEDGMLDKMTNAFGGDTDNPDNTVAGDDDGVQGGSNDDVDSDDESLV